MSGHSKWHNIQAHKGKQDQKKAASFTKVARMITVAAKQGGGDPNMNFTLRLAIEKAKEVNLPKENIERAIKKGTGELADEIQLEEVMYEGFGPGGVGILVDVVTDNKNRTAPEMKHFFSLHGGTFAGPGSVKWQFNQKGAVRINAEEKAKITDKDSFELALIDAGAEDIQMHDFGIEVYCPVDKLQKVIETIKANGVEVAESGIEWIAKETTPVTPEVSEQLRALANALEAMDDVRAVYTNEA